MMYIYELAATFALAFIMGLTGAVVPGPTLVAVIGSSLREGWKAGPKVAAGHILVELAIFPFIIIGAGAAAGSCGSCTGLIMGIGGAALILFGALVIRASRTTFPGASEPMAVANPYLAGALTSAANPYFWIWWFTIGSALLIAELRMNLIMPLVFMAGHFTADISWYTLVSSGVHRGRAFLSERGYRALLILCGLFLIGCGVCCLIMLCTA